QAHTTGGREFPISALTMAERGSRAAIAHVEASQRHGRSPTEGLTGAACSATTGVTVWRVAGPLETDMRDQGPGGYMEQASGGMRGQRERIVIRGAYLLTCDGADRVYTSGDIVIDEGHITAVGQVADEAVVRGARVIEGRDRLVAPGLVNAHMHS